MTTTVCFIISEEPSNLSLLNIC